LFARRLNWNSPIGKTIKVDEEIGTIVGIVSDFHFDNTFWPITPAAFYLEKTDPNYMLIRTKDRYNIAVVSEHLKTLWDEFSPNIPFNSFTLDEYFKRSNGDAWLMPKALGMLGLLAILYSCLGLLALATYAVRQRKKEISIRKVLGASIPVILTMLSKDFLKLILMANIIALPLAYFASNSLLDIVFSIHISIGIGILLITAFFTLLIAVIAITTQTFRAAYANPVDSLKYE
jgi:putative ABC transport system permease protein